MPGDRWEKERITREQEETFEGNEYVHYLDCGNDFRDIYTYVKTYQIVYFIPVQFIAYQLFFIKLF